MTFNEAWERALTLLGYTNSYGISGNSTLSQRKLAALSAVYSELFYLCGKSGEPKVELDAQIDLPPIVVNDCFVYGVAMWVAQTESDGDNQALYANIYTQKRAQCTRIRKMKDKGVLC